MSVFARAVPASKPRTKESQNVAYFYAVILVVFALTQLFTFDTFVGLVEDFGFPGGTPIAHLVAGIIVASEVFALPFLLRMRLSPLMRLFSMGLGWLVAVIWLKISLWAVLIDTSASNIGMFGSLVDLVPGWWAVFISIALGLLAAWASWGLWPAKQLKK